MADNHLRTYPDGSHSTLAWRRSRAGVYVNGNSTDPLSFVIQKGNGYGRDRLASRWYLTIRTCDEKGTKLSIGGYGTEAYPKREDAEKAAEAYKKARMKEARECGK